MIKNIKKDKNLSSFFPFPFHCLNNIIYLFSVNVMLCFRCTQEREMKRQQAVVMKEQVTKIINLLPYRGMSMCKDF